MRVINIKRSIKAIILTIILIIFVILILINTSFSHTKTKYKVIYISSGDTLWDIAKYEQNNNIYFQDQDIRNIVDEIKYTNNLKNSDLKIGQILNIPSL